MLSQRHALVTGAGSGIGAAIALALVQNGCRRLTLAGRSREKLEHQAQLLRQHAAHVELHLASVDISSGPSVQLAVQQAQAQLGPVNILVNNAGQAQSQPFLRTDAALWQRMLDVNLSGTFHITQAVLPAMLEAAAAATATPGRIINIASTAALMGYAYVSAYVAAKHGVVGLTKSLALEMARKNITVNAVCPGYTETEIVHEAVRNIMEKTGQSQDQALASLSKSNPQQRLVQPEEIAQAVLWLCGPGSAAVNGQAIAIDGGEQAG